VMRPTLLPPASVNHVLPSGPATIPVGIAFGVDIGYSVISFGAASALHGTTTASAATVSPVTISRQVRTTVEDA
jgi:hypothetical protein